MSEITPAFERDVARSAYDFVSLQRDEFWQQRDEARAEVERLRGLLRRVLATDRLDVRLEREVRAELRAQTGREDSR